MKPFSAVRFPDQNAFRVGIVLFFVDDVRGVDRIHWNLVQIFVPIPGFSSVVRMPSSFRHVVEFFISCFAGLARKSSSSFIVRIEASERASEDLKAGGNIIVPILTRAAGTLYAAVSHFFFKMLAFVTDCGQEIAVIGVTCAARHIVKFLIGISPLFRFSLANNVFAVSSVIPCRFLGQAP